MKKTISIISAVVLVATAFVLFSFVTHSDNSVPATAKTDQMVADWERAKAFTSEYLDVATDELVTFKPTEEIRTFGQQMLHLAEANYGLVAGATGKQSPVPFGSLEKSDQYTTKAALKKAVLDSYDYAIAAAKEMNDQKLAEPTKIFNFEMTREVALNKAFEHQTHHRGQSTVYIRLKGIKPPNEKLF
jgi:uncharacterized damage-inducible protein DinB